MVDPQSAWVCERTHSLKIGELLWWSVHRCILVVQRVCAQLLWTWDYPSTQVQLEIPGRRAATRRPGPREAVPPRPIGLGHLLHVTSVRKKSTLEALKQ